MIRFCFNFYFIEITITYKHGLFDLSYGFRSEYRNNDYIIIVGSCGFFVLHIFVVAPLYLIITDGISLTIYTIIPVKKIAQNLTTNRT